MVEQIHALLRRHLPGYEARTVAKLGEGWDNVVYEVNGDLVLRASKAACPEDRAALTRREAELLAVVAELSPLPVPEPVFADADAGVLAYTKVPGCPLVERPEVDAARLAPTLGSFLAHLHRTPLGRVEGLAPREAEPFTSRLARAEQDYAEAAPHLSPEARRLVEDFLGRAPPAEPDVAVFCHNDLGSEHVLVDGDGAVSGVIDWTDAAVTDPVRDLALIYRDLGPGVFDLVAEHYDGCVSGPARERAAFYARCALLEDIAYGLHTGARRYADEGIAHLHRTFG